MYLKSTNTKEKCRISRYTFKRKILIRYNTLLQNIFHRTAEHFSTYNVLLQNTLPITTHYFCTLFTLLQNTLPLAPRYCRTLFHLHHATAEHFSTYNTLLQNTQVRVRLLSGITVQRVTYDLVKLFPSKKCADESFKVICNYTEL
jgi:hypothetical protein